MSSRRRSVQDAVRVIITRNPYLYRGLRMQVINYSAAARYIHEDVELISGSDVDPNTIVTAIMRFSRETTIIERPEPQGRVLVGRLNLVTDVKEITISASPRDQIPIIEQVLELQRKGFNIRMHQFPRSLKIVTTIEAMTDFMQEFWQHQPDVKEGYAELNIQVGPHEDRLDRIAVLTDLLFRNGVHMVDAYFSDNEISIIINEEDASKAFDALRSQST